MFHIECGIDTQILWINFVSDGIPALSLGFDSASPNLMKVPPRRESNILGLSMIRYILVGGTLIALVCLLTFYLVEASFGLGVARASTFTLIIVLQMILPFVIIRHHSIASNKKLLISVILVFVMQALILTVPQLRVIFKI